MTRAVRRFTWKVYESVRSLPVFNPPLVRNAGRALFARLLPREILVTFEGRRIWVYSRGSPVGRHLIDNEVWEPGGTSVFKAVVRPGMTVIDAGAHVGYYSTLAAELVGPTGKVIAFEPEPRSRSMLNKSIKENDYGNVLVVPTALSDTSGEVDLITNSDSAPEFFSISKFRGTQNQKRRVPTTTLDEFLADDLHVDFIKIDIEGAELAAFAGMKEILDSNPDLKILMEWVPEDYRANGYDPVQFIRTMFHKGYNAWRVDFRSEALVQLSLSAAIELCDRAWTNLFLSRSEEDWIS